MGVQCTISGLSELQAKLAALPTKLAKRVLRPALTDAGEVIQQAAGVAAPRKSGHLTTNIVVDVTVHNDLVADVKVGPDKSAFYGQYAELGTAPHMESSPKGTKPYQHPGEPARPWLRPAFASSVDDYTNALIKNIEEGLDEVSK
jgi:HK97 gp10 family phage protein